MSKSSKQIAAQVAKQLNKRNRTSGIRKTVQRKKVRAALLSSGIQRARRVRKRGVNPIRPMPGQRIERTGLLTARNAPMMNRAMILEEDEYIQDVVGSVGFATTGFACNPGQSTVFPWGSRIAQLYEEYDFESLEFYVTSEVSGYATQGQTGVVILSFDYDASDAAPTTKQQVEATNPHTVPCLPSTSVIQLTVDCSSARASDAKFVRPGAQPANTDIKTYDIGNLYVSTQGQANTSAFGELHVRYRCRLKKQVLENSTIVGGAIHFSGVAPTTANNFAGAALQPGGTPSLTGITLGVNTIVFPAGIPGNYLVVLDVAGSTSATGLNYALGTGLTALNALTTVGARDATDLLGSASGTANIPAFITITITCATSGGTLTLTPSTLVGGDAMDLFIVSLPSTVLTVLPPRVFQDRLDKLEALLASRLSLETVESPYYEVDSKEDVEMARHKAVMLPPTPPSWLGKRLSVV